MRDTDESVEAHSHSHSRQAFANPTDRLNTPAHHVGSRDAPVQVKLRQLVCRLPDRPARVCVGLLVRGRERNLRRGKSVRHEGQRPNGWPDENRSTCSRQSRNAADKGPLMPGQCGRCS
jgi:hypothetical protein